MPLLKMASPLIIVSFTLATFAAMQTWAIQPDKLAGFRLSEHDVSGLIYEPKACKKPGAFSYVSTAGPNGSGEYHYPAGKVKGVDGLYRVDPANWYRFVDLNGDGICEVEAETCNFKTAIQHPEKPDVFLCDSWLSAFKYHKGKWIFDGRLHGGSSGVQFRHSATFKYFDPKTGKVRFTIYHDFSYGTANPGSNWPNYMVAYFKDSDHKLLRLP